MLPFFRPQDEIRHEPVQPSDVRVGDVVTVRPQADRLVTHRVVRILQRGGRRLFLTKGDNRLTPDPLVSGDQMVGRVTRCGRRDMTGAGWRWLNALMGRLSDGQARIYGVLARSGLNRFRHALEKRGWLPKVRLRGIYQVLSAPLGCLTWARSAAGSCEAARRRAALRARGIRVRRWEAGDMEPMSRIWNRSFPTHPTTAERLFRQVCRSPWFDPSGCFVLARGGDLLGWAFSSIHGSAPGPPAKKRLGFLEFLALAEAGWSIRGDRLLLQESIGWLKRRGVSEMSFGPLLTERNGFGFALTPELSAAAAQGFTLSHRSDEQVVARSGYRVAGRTPSLRLLEIRPLRAAQDEAALSDFFRRNGCRYFSGVVREHLAREGGENRFRVAVSRGRPVGFCRLLLDSQIEDYRDIGNVWSASRPSVPTGYFTHLVVDAEYRSQGIGTALTARAVETLFREGCEEVNLWGARSGLYQRLGFVKRGHFVRMRRAR